MIPTTSATHLENLSLETLLSMREKHPYFSTLHAVAAKKMKTSHYFSSERTQAAFRASDRNELRKFLESGAVLNMDETTEEAVSIPISATVIENELAVDKSQTHSFYIWISLYNKVSSTLSDKPIETPVVDDLDQLMLSSAQSASYFSETIAHEKSYSKGLDSFLESQKTRKKTSSAASENDLVTETLAKLYLAQGMNDKAVDVYKKLMLKNPEKSSYFALQIQKLKK